MRSRHALLMAGVLALAAAIRIAVLIDSHDWIVLRVPVLDAGFYHESAKGFVDGSWPGAEPYFMGPLYSYIVGGLYALFGPDPLSVRIAQAVAGLIGLALIGVLTRRIAGERAALAAVAIGALYGPLVFYEQLLLMATWVSLLALVMLERSVALARGSGARASIPLGLAFGAAIALRGTAVLYAVPIVWCAGRRLLGRHGAAWVLCAMAIVAPFTIHNLRSGSTALLTTNLGWNLFIGNHEGARGTFAYPNGWRAEGDPSGRAFASQIAGRALDADETNAFWLQRARGAIARDPLGALGRVGRKVALFLQSEEMPQNESYRFFRRNVPPSRVAVLGWWIVLPLALAGAIAGGGLVRGGVPLTRRRELTAVAGFAAVPLLASMAFFVTGRYRVPSIPFLCILAGVGVSWLIEAARSSPRRAVGAGLLIVTGALTLLLLPPPFDVSEARARDHEHVGLRYQRAGMLRAAEEQYRLAIGVNPGDGDALNNLGTVLVEGGRLEEARGVFERAARAQPGNPVPLQNLASVRGRLGDDAGAEATLRRAIEIDSRNAALWVSLGTALALQNRFEEAVAALERADRLTPGDPRIREMLRGARAHRDANERPGEVQPEGSTQ